MAFVFLFAGIVILTSGVRGTQDDLFKLVEGDIRPADGSTGFIPWILAILIIGALGYVKQFRSLSHGFMALVIIAMIIKAYQRNPQIFDQFNAALGIKSGSSLPNSFAPNLGVPNQNNPPPGWTFQQGDPNTGKGAGFYPLPKL